MRHFISLQSILNTVQSSAARGPNEDYRKQIPPVYCCLMLDIQISLNANILERVCSYKYLGLILDEHLNYNKHMTEMTKLISHKLFLLSKIRRYITKDACINIFKTMVLSVIEYCDIIYAGTTQANITKIDNFYLQGLTNLYKL